MKELLQQAHVEWKPLLQEALSNIDKAYIQFLLSDTQWLPGKMALFNAFSIPLSKTHYILFGESPYPRANSANGYAFWDNAVQEIWAPNGLSRPVNRATSLRNFIKMLLHARDDLKDNFSQGAIAELDKSLYIKTAHDLFHKLLDHGFLLLNTSLVYSEGRLREHAKIWAPFLNHLLKQIDKTKPDIQYILFGKFAETLMSKNEKVILKAEHPYNLSFITNPSVTHFFKPFDLLKL